MAARFWVGNSGTWDASDTTHWAATSGGAGGQSVPGPSDTVTIDAASGTGTITVATDFNTQTLTCGAMSGMTLDFSANNNSPTVTGISTSGSSTRTINWGSGTFTVTGNSSTIFSNGTTTGQTMTGSATFNFTYSGSVGTRSFQFGGTGANTISTTTCKFNITAGTDIIAMSGTNTGTSNLDFTGFSGTWSSTSTTITIANDLTLSATMTNSVTAGIQWTVNGRSGTLTSNGKAFASSFIINGTGTTVTLADHFVTSSSLTLTLGNFDANNKNVTCFLFNTNNANTRTLTMGSGTWTITGNNTTVWHMLTTTNLTYNPGTSTINFTYAGSVGTRVINSGEGAFPMQNVKISAGTDLIQTAGGGATANFSGHFDWTGFAGIWDLNSSYNSNRFYGDLTLGPAMTVNANAGGTKTINFVGTSVTQTLTTNGINLKANVTVVGTSNIVLLNGNLDMTNTAASVFTLTSGTFNASGYNVTCSSVSSSNTNTRTLAMGSGIWTLTGTGIVWGIGTTTGLTMTATNSTIVISDTSASSKTFSTGTNSANYGTVTLTPGGSGAVIFTNTGTRTFAAFNATGPKTITWSAGATYTFTALNLTGTSGNLVTLASSTPGSPYTFSVASGLVAARYVSLQDSAATGGAYFQAVNSVDVSGNTGWNFTTASDSAGRVGSRIASFGGRKPYVSAFSSPMKGYKKLGG